MIIVTGCKGIIGRAVMTKLAAKGINTLGIHRQNFDLTSGASLMEYVNHRPDAVIHLAAAVPHSTHYPDSPSSAMKTRIIDETVFNAVSEWECRLVYASTCSLYDKSDPSIKTESSPVLTKSNSCYLQAKYDGEQLLNLLPSLTILRVPAPLGPGIPDTLVVKRFINTGMAGKPIQLWGSGAREQNFVDVRDLADAFIKSSFCKDDGIFNLSADVPTTMISLASLIVETAQNGSYELSALPDPLDGEYARYSNQKASRVLGWKPVIHLKESLSTLCANQ